MGEESRPPRSDLDLSNHHDAHNLDKHVQFKVGVTLLNYDAWDMWFFVGRWLCDRPLFGSYNAICILRWTTLTLQDMLVIPSSDVLTVIPERQSFTLCQRTRQVVDNLLYVRLCLQKLQEFACVGVFLAYIFCPPSPGSQNTAWNGLSVYAPKVTSLRFHSFLFTKQAFEVGFPNAVAWLLHVHSTNPRCPDVANAGRCSKNDSRSNLLPKSVKASFSRSSTLFSHTCNLNPRTVLVYRQRVIHSPSCMHLHR